MSKGIIVEMPEQLYVSYQSDRTVENEFYFVIYQQYSAIAYSGQNILQAPFVTIHGFEQLVRIPQKTKEEQEAQIMAAAERFVDQLSIDPFWTVTYHYDRDTEELAMILTCTEPELSADFKVKIFTDNFICNCTDTHQPVVLTIHTEGFEEVFGETEKYSDYRVSIRTVYAPCITEFMLCCGDSEYTGQVYVNPEYDNPITLHWNIVGNGRLEHTLQKGNQYMKAASAADRITDTVDASVIYTLEVENQKGFRDMEQISVDITGWHKVGGVEGLFQDVQGIQDLAGIVRYENYYYCYMHPVLYQSTDGCKWIQASENTAMSKEIFDYTTCSLHENSLYVMAGNVGNRLKIMKYCFRDRKWEASSAYQNCVSADGHLAFSQYYSYYGQTVVTGMSISGHDDESEWMYWNRNNFAITTDGQQARASDLCFWKDQFYAVILCEDGNFYFYECRDKIEDALFVCEAGGAGRIHLLPTTNKLFIAVNGRLYDAVNKKPADVYFPTAERDDFCLGSDKTEIFGIFNDGNFWIYK